MNIEFEYNQCLARGEHQKSFIKRDSHKSVCNYFMDKVRSCRMECVGNENDKQETIMHKCLPNVSTDKELDDCVKKNLMESTINLCRLKCEVRGMANLRDISGPKH